LQRKNSNAGHDPNLTMYLNVDQKISTHNTVVHYNHVLPNVKEFGPQELCEKDK
jgi:hypothetical protein